MIGDLYEDLARTAPIAGVLFNDDAVLRDTDDLGAHAPAPGPERTRALIEFTNELKARVQRWRPEIATARNLFAEPVLHPQSESWYAQSLPAFLAAYNEVALMAMPALENSNAPNPWWRKLAERVGSVPGGFNRTVFELQTVDWRTTTADCHRAGLPGRCSCCRARAFFTWLITRTTHRKTTRISRN